MLAGYLVAFDKHMNLVSVVNNKVYLFVCFLLVAHGNPKLWILSWNNLHVALFYFSFQ